MASTRPLILVSAAVALAAAAMWLLSSAHTWLKVDQCLDQGGRWDYPGHSCQRTAPAVAGRLVLRDSAAYQLGLIERVLRQVDSLGVPLAVRTAANRLRIESGGDVTAAIRYYAGPGGQVAVLVPSRSFEGEDPHIIAAFNENGAPLTGTALPSYVAAEAYCPASGQAHTNASSRDSADGCRYFRPVTPGPPPSEASELGPPLGLRAARKARQS